MNSATRRFVTQWKFEILIGGLVWLVYFVHVVPGGGVNPNRYFDLTHSIVNHKVLNIDEYQENTIDKAYKDGHYYSVGLPGPSLAAIPAYFVFKAIYSLLPDSWLEQISTVQSYKQGTSGFYLQDTTDFFLSTIWLTWFVLSLVSAISITILYRLLQKVTGCSSQTALLTALVYAFGTPIFFYSTTYFSHVFSASLIIVCLYLLWKLESHINDGLLFGLGFFCGSMLLFETQGILVSGLFVFYCIARWGWRVLPFFSLGAVLPILFLLTYNTLAFGRPLVSAYQYIIPENFDQYHSVGFLGFTLPRLDRLFGLTFSLQRGLWIYSPVYLCAIPGIYFSYKKKKNLPLLTLCLTAFILLFLLIASYEGWDGAAAFGPRQILLAMPFLTFFLANGLEIIPFFVSLPLAFLSIVNNWLGSQFGFANNVFQHWRTFISTGFTLPVVLAITDHSTGQNWLLQVVSNFRWVVNLAYFIMVAGIIIIFWRLSQTHKNRA